VKDVTEQLLQALNLEHVVLSRHGGGLVALLGELLQRDLALFRAARRFQPDLLVGNNSPCVAHVGAILGRPSIVFDDTEIHLYNRLLYRNFVTEIHTPACYRLDLGPRQIRYRGQHALAYLHPTQFRLDPAVISSYGLDGRDPYFLLRFVRWGAAHDAGVRGLSTAQKEELVRLVGRFGRAVVSVEGDVPEALRHHCLAIRPLDMHQVLAGSAGLIGESATMASEAACLGRPSLLIDRFGRGYTDQLERDYQLCARISPKYWGSVLAAVERLCRHDAFDPELVVRHQRFIDDAIPVSWYQLDQILRLAGKQKEGRAMGKRSGA
jgi:hypothetical protein